MSYFILGLKPEVCECSFLTYQEREVSLGNRTFRYFVIPQEPRLPHFVLRMTGDNSDGHVLGIADSVDERYRPYAVAHEFIEFTEIGIEEPERCIRALEEEIELVPENIRKSYLSMRRDFFRDLIGYCSQQPEHYTQYDLEQFRQNFIRLEELLKQ